MAVMQLAGVQGLEDVSRLYSIEPLMKTMRFLLASSYAGLYSSTKAQQCFLPVCDFTVYNDPIVQRPTFESEKKSDLIVS